MFIGSSLEVTWAWTGHLSLMIHFPLFQYTINSPLFEYYPYDLFSTNHEPTSERIKAKYGLSRISFTSHFREGGRFM
jgi:hypothetical protein